jgi:hypothetical protein
MIRPGASVLFDRGFYFGIELKLPALSTVCCHEARRVCSSATDFTAIARAKIDR